MDELRYPEWEQTYHEALLELNPQKLVQRVSAAESAILSRLQEIRIRSDSRWRHRPSKMPSMVCVF